MALGNLNINVNANIGGFVSSMDTARASARDSMMKSSASVDDFRNNLSRSSQEIRSAADQMGSGMRAANDAIIQSSDESAQAIQNVSDAANNAKFENLSEKVASAFAAGLGGGYAVAQTWLQKTEDFVKTKLLILGAAIAVGIAATTAFALYTAYKLVAGSMSFIGGLFTGSSYKSESIDAVKKANEEAKELQENLRISANDANALNDALRRIGVDKNDYTTVYKNAETAMRSNGDELDRLGIKYKDANGKFIQTGDFLQNVKSKLEEYTDGWDRNQAAASIGAGSLKQVNDALKISQQEIEKSRDRLNDFNLGIGPESQAAMAAYEKAVREFSNETTLTGQGFERAWADQIMPVLTDLAEFFKDGFPVAVRAFRYSMATITSLFYGLKEVVFIVAESILGAIEALGMALGGVATAIAAALTGDFSGAKAAMVSGWEDAKTRIGQIGDNIVSQSQHNAAAMKMAWGADDRQASGIASPKPGKKWNPKDKTETAYPAAKSAFQAYMDELDRMNVKVTQSEYAAMRLKAAQLAEKEGIKDSVSEIKIQSIQRNESAKAVELYTKKLEDERAQYEFQTSIMGENSLAQETMTMAMQKRLAVEQQILATKQSSKPLDDQAIASLRAKTEAEISAMSLDINKRNEISRSWEFGEKKTLQTYIDDVGNAAQQAARLWTDAFRGMEDALVNFVKTGKFDFKSLADSIITDIIRIQVQNSITKPLAQSVSDSGGFGGLFSGIGSSIGNMFSGLFGGGRASGGPVDSGMLYQVNETGAPELLTVGGSDYLMMGAQAGRVTPIQLSAAAQQGGGITYAPVIQVDARGAQVGVAQQIEAAMRQFVAQNQQVFVGIVDRAYAKRGIRSGLA